MRSGLGLGLASPSSQPSVPPTLQTWACPRRLSTGADLFIEMCEVL